MTVYEVVDVTPDTPEWETERTHSVGASEVAAVMGLSPYQTALDVYKTKHGAGDTFDPLLSFVGHESEPIIQKWVEQFSGVNVRLQPAFMGRSTVWPFLHASFDRVSHDPFTTWQFKTAHQYTGHKWDEGVPVPIRVQVQAEMAVAGTQKAAVVVWIGGREFRLYWELRDNLFITEQMIPQVEAFWAGVLDDRPPLPQTVREIPDVFPGQPGLETDLSDEAFDVLERITVLNSDIKTQSEERDALKVALAKYAMDAESLWHDGRKVATWKTQKGRAGFDMASFRAVHPDLAAQFTRTGSPFKVLRTIKEKTV